MYASREAETFVQGLADPESVQHEVLMERIVGPNVDSVFGREHDFSRIKSVDDYRRAVPIRTYDEHEPWIDRIVHGEQGVLTSEDVKRFFLTSGSTSKPKYIPVTNSFIRTKSRAFGIYWSHVFADHPEAKTGRMITNFSDSGAPEKSPCGLPASSESAYWASVTRATQLKERPIIPKEVARIKDADARYYAIARVLLEEAFTVIMTLNPSTILLLFKKLVEYAGDLVADIERGGIGDRFELPDDARSIIARTYTGNPRRAEALRALMGEGGMLAHRIWPALSLAISWRSPMLKPYLDLLAPHYGTQVAARDYLMMASEGVMGMPLQDGGSGGVCGVGLHFYEFVPEEEIEHAQPTVLLPHELEVGQKYVLILTNGSGLYRYNIGDVIRVPGKVRNTPMIEFLHRAGRTCSMTGEKLTEDQVTAAVSEVAAQLGLAVESFTLRPAAEGFPRYVALVELKQSVDEGVLRQFPRRLDAALDRHNIEYGSKRSSERLEAPELWLLAPGSYEGWRRSKTAQGTSDSQVKPTHLTRDPAFGQEFTVLSKYVSDAV